MRRLVWCGAWVYAVVLVVAPVWALRILFYGWCAAWLGCVVVGVVLGARRLGHTFSAWRVARRDPALFPYGYQLGPERLKGESFMEDRQVAP